MYVVSALRRTLRSPAEAGHDVPRINFRAPIILMVLAATAIPVELRSPALAALDFDVRAFDVVANIAGYVPVGIVLGGCGRLAAVVFAAVLSTFAETSQFVIVHRVPSAIDVASNVIGAILGIAVSERWGSRVPEFRINKWKALVAATLALVLVLRVWATAGDAPSTRGATSPGTLEAYWKLDESSGRVALDSSGHGLNGRLNFEPMHVAGMRDGAVRLDGAKEYIDFGHSTAFRLAGSLTISAWINSSSYPVDDAAIVSSRNVVGYQLDTTIDRGPRTIGFKLGNACGRLMARYGATPLSLNTWYHAAGVYDAAAQTLDVYLNGEPDNGVLVGRVTGTQRSSRESVYVGRRSNPAGFEFAGTIDDVRVYSRALTRAEIVADMEGRAIESRTAQAAAAAPVDGRNGARRPRDPDASCVSKSDLEDASIPGAAAVFGVLSAIACVGLWPSGAPLLSVVVSLAAGLLLVAARASTLPVLGLWLIPLVSLAGGLSVALSVHRRRSEDS